MTDQTKPALLSKLRDPVADERAHHRNDGFSSLSLWWTMIEAEAELIGEPIKDDRPILSFMGSGASHQVTARDIRAALASAPVAKPKRAPLDDWRVQAIAECLETEWDDMTPASAEADARLIVGYLTAYEKESDEIEARHAAEPVDPVVQAVRNLRASAPVAGEAQITDDDVLDILAEYGEHHTEHGRIVFDKWTLQAAGEALLQRVRAEHATPQTSTPDFADAYEGAREDLAIWKRRALEAERDLRAERETSSRLVAALNAENGPTHMGEPAPQASEAVAAEALEVAREALMEIADLADVDADDRSVIVNQALTKIDRITALSAQPGAQKEKSDEA